MSAAEKSPMLGGFVAPGGGARCGPRLDRGPRDPRRRGSHRCRASRPSARDRLRRWSRWWLELPRSSSAARAGDRSSCVWGGVAGGAAALPCILSIDFGLAPVETSLWGGLLVTLVVAIVGIVASLPLGILLALGRRSKMPVDPNAVSVVFIEFVRGVPLITVLFMASVMLPLFLPPGVNFDKLLRALIGVALFSAAYMAEVVRGGLQAIPQGPVRGGACARASATGR